jgi:hypothetical protein
MGGRLGRSAASMPYSIKARQMATAPTAIITVGAVSAKAPTGSQGNREGSDP